MYSPSIDSSPKSSVDDDSLEEEDSLRSWGWIQRMVGGGVNGNVTAVGKSMGRGEAGPKWREREG